MHQGIPTLSIIDACSSSALLFYGSDSSLFFSDLLHIICFSLGADLSIKHT